MDLKTPPFKLGDIAQWVGATLHGDADLAIYRAIPLDAATGSGGIAFLANARFDKYLGATRASAVVVPPAALEGCPVAALVAENPYLTWAKTAALFARPRRIQPGIHPSAVVAESAQLGPGCSIGPLVSIGPGARIGADVVVEASAVINEDAEVGEHCTIGPGAVLHYAVMLGRRVRVHAGAVIGADGFGLAFDRGHWLNVPQLGSVRIGDDCEIGANSTVDRGALGDTVLGCDVRLDNLVQIGHNVQIGDHTAMAGCVGVAGSATIGKYVQVGGASGIGGHITIADHVVINSMSQVTHSIYKAGTYSAGLPLTEHTRWLRNAARFRHLDELVDRVKSLEKRLSKQSYADSDNGSDCPTSDCG